MKKQMDFVYKQLLNLLNRSIWQLIMPSGYTTIESTSLLFSFLNTRVLENLLKTDYLL
ncbi:hypothetical protein CEAn_00367 [Coxiella endosymbiont of Amblyomma nuttalli]|nr:hypothetical protein CEAn_00367 [Coxiella endosymbiont of Amblyomma nuttalli]